MMPEQLCPNCQHPLAAHVGAAECTVGQGPFDLCQCSLRATDLIPEQLCPNCKHGITEHVDGYGCTTVIEGLVCPCDMNPSDLRLKPVLIEEHARMLHAACGGMVTGILGQKLICSGCGEEMTGMVSDEDRVE